MTSLPLRQTIVGRHPLEPSVVAAIVVAAAAVAAAIVAVVLLSSCDSSPDNDEEQEEFSDELFGFEFSCCNPSTIGSFLFLQSDSEC